MENHLILRENYINRLWEWKKRDDHVKILTGMRRCGKSTILKQFSDKLCESGENHILFINFESKDFEFIEDYHDLNKYISEHVGKEHTYVLFDEIQNVKGWEKSINSLLVDYDADVYITGSNAYLLSSEFATYISGRYVEIKIYPLSFKEYLELNPPKVDMSVDQRFMDYCSTGSLPIVRPDDWNTNELLVGICSTIIRKDVSQRLKLIDLRTLDDITRFLLSNIGNVTNVYTISEAISSTSVTVKKYLQSMEDAFLLYKTRRYDVKGKKEMNTLEKYYVSDVGIRNAVLGEVSDIGRIIENIVFIELLRRGYSVTFGSYYNNEIDFLAKKFNTTEYYQVSFSIADEKTFEREVKTLSLVPDNFRKTILTADRIFNRPNNGIEVVNVIDWLLNSD